MHGGRGKDQRQHGCHGKTDASGGGLSSVAHAAEIHGEANEGNRQSQAK
jgi:hypothetical protein